MNNGNKLLNTILEFITQKGLGENYSLNDLHEFLNYLKSNITDDQKCYNDSNNITKSIADSKINNER